MWGFVSISFLSGRAHSAWWTTIWNQRVWLEGHTSLSINWLSFSIKIVIFCKGAAFVRVMVQLLKDCMFLKYNKSLCKIYWHSNSSIPSCSSAAWYIPYRVGEMFPAATEPLRALSSHLLPIHFRACGLDLARCVSVPCGSFLTQFHPSCNPKIPETVVPLVVTVHREQWCKSSTVFSLRHWMLVMTLGMFSQPHLNCVWWFPGSYWCSTSVPSWQMPIWDLDPDS